MTLPRHLTWAFAFTLLLVGADVADVSAQTDCVSGTGSNATYIFPATMGKQISGTSLEEGDVVIARDASGQCVGKLIFSPGTSQAMAVWGDDVMTEVKDGMATGEKIDFEILDVSSSTSYDHVTITYLEGNGLYARGGISIAGQISGPSNAIEADLHVLLEGPYDASVSVMSAELNANGMLPTNQPYAGTGFDGTPLDYDETVAVAPAVFANHPNIVDYVLVELRSATDISSIVARRAALLLSDGSVVDIDGISMPTFGAVSPGSYYVVVRHRNHLAVMSASPVDFSTGVGHHDFTTAASKAYGTFPMAEFADGRFGLFAGDANGNGQIQSTDKNNFWWKQMGKGGYTAGDFNLNGEVQNTDKINFWWKNVGKGTTAP